MKKCKSCQKEIDTKAKKCPYCQTDQRNWFIRHPILTVLLVLIIFGIIGAAGSGDKKKGTTVNSGNNSQGQQNISDEQKEKEYTIGETIATEKMAITITAVEQHDVVGGQYINEKASTGGTLVSVDWNYKNTSEKPIGSFSQPSIKLVDSKGTEYSFDIGKSSAYTTEKKIDSKIMSDLNPGITVNDAKVFELSKEAYAKGGWKVKVMADGNTYLVALQ